MSEEHVQGCSASDALGLGFEANSLTLEPMRPLSPGHAPFQKSYEMGRQGLDLEP